MKRSSVFLIALTVSLFFVEYAFADAWTAKTPMPTRRHAPAATVNGKIYVTAGSDGSQHFDMLEVYDPSTDSWATKASTLGPRNSATSCSAMGKVYLIGGEHGAWKDSIEEYDPSTDSWTLKTPMPTARGSLTCSTVNDKIYVIGGLRGDSSTRLNIVEEYNPRTDTWTTKAPMPTARYGATSSVINGEIYVIGGSIGTVLNSVEIYNPVTNTWATTIPSMPTARYGATSNVINGEIYVIGGSDHHTWAGATYLDTVEKYNPSTNTWTLMTPMPTGRSAPASGIVNGKMYVIGGVDYTKTNYTNIVEEYDPLRDGLVAHYPFDGDATDASGNGNDGTVYGATLTTDRFGNPYSAYSFDGIDDFIEVLHHASLNLTDSLTISVWVNYNQLNRTISGFDWQAILTKNWYGGSYGLMQSTKDTWNTGIKTLRYYHAGLTSATTSYDWITVEPGTWHLIALTYDGISTRIYTDANLVMEDNVTGSIQINASNLIIGKSPSPPGLPSPYPMDGLLDEIRIYNRTLSGSEIQALYDQAPKDCDEDGIVDDEDNCECDLNPDQADNDSDGQGDVCDQDDDNDGVLDASDNCPLISNSEQEDNDLDAIGDICDDDDDNDYVLDEADNCQFVANADQADMDGDGLGNVCDGDPDGDGVLADDNCPYIPNPAQEDNDFDGAGDVCDDDDDNDDVLDTVDNCPLTANADQADLDGDNIGDACDNDIDGDGIDNVSDNCPLIINAGQDDTDVDGDGDVCDDDDDDDGVLDPEDNCSLIYNADQNDSDGDGQGDACDGDLDGDGWDNESDNCPSVANGNQNDFDKDNLGDVCDDDSDGDGVTNDNDTCQFTELDSVVDASNGCSIDQLCPCDGPRGMSTAWKNHGKYVSCVAKTSENFVGLGLITAYEKDSIVSEAAQSYCGAK